MFGFVEIWLIRSQNWAVSWYSLCPGCSDRGLSCWGWLSAGASCWLFPNPDEMPTLGVVGSLNPEGMGSRRSTVRL